MCDSKKASHPRPLAGGFFCPNFPHWAAHRLQTTLVPLLWLKALHIVFIASWFAGLFYLPRIFGTLAMVAPDSMAERDRLLLMARKLYKFMTILAVPALVLGLCLWLGYGIGRGPGRGWMSWQSVFCFAVGRLPPCVWPDLAQIWSGHHAARPCLVPMVQRSAGADDVGSGHFGGGQALLRAGLEPAPCARQRLGP